MTEPNEGAVPGPPAAAPEGAPADGVQWHHLHKVTPFLNAWKVAAAIVAVVLVRSSEGLEAVRSGGRSVALVIAGVVVVAVLISLGYNLIAWRRMRYGLGEDTIFLHKGVLFRSQRHVRLDRVQAVEVTQPLLARFFGFAKLKVESAGGGQSNLELAFLTEAEAQRLRNEILARAAGVRAAHTAPGAPVVGVPADGVPADGVPAAGAPAGSTPRPAGLPAAAEAPAYQVLSLDVGRLLGSLVRSLGLMIALGALITLVVITVIRRDFAFLTSMIVPVLGAAGYVWSRFAGEFGFTVSTSPDGLRLRQGLLETTSSTVPPGRVQALQLSQPLLWRRKGWWRLQVNIAGQGLGGSDNTTKGLLYPVADEQELARVLPLVLPDLGVADPLAVLRAGLTGTGDEAGFVTTPRRARWLDPITWRRQGFRSTETALLLRSGRLWRRLQLVPHERTQSVALEQGPLERRLDVASVTVHSTPGQIVNLTAIHLDTAVAHDLLVDQARRAGRARRAAGPERWMSRDVPMPPARPVPGAVPPAPDAAGAPDDPEETR